MKNIIELCKETYLFKGETFYEFKINGKSYLISRDGDLLNRNFTKLSWSIEKSKNYIEFGKKIKVNKQSTHIKLHKLMMQFFGLSKEQCLEKGFLFKYSDELYESLRKGDKAKNKKVEITEEEIISKLDNWCASFINRYDMVYNPSRYLELNRYWIKYREAYLEGSLKGFQPFVPDRERLRKQVSRLLKDKELADYYFRYLDTHDIDKIHFTREQYEERINPKVYEWKDYKQEEPTIEHDTRLDRCTDIIRRCAEYADSIDRLFEVADILEVEYMDGDKEYMMSSEVLINRLRQYNIYNDSRSDRIILTNDNRSYSNQVDRYMNDNMNKLL